MSDGYDCLIEQDYGQIADYEKYVVDEETLPRVEESQLENKAEN